VVDVDLGKGEVARDGVLVRQLGEDGGDGPAGRAPVGVEVYDDIGGGFQQGIELGGFGGLVDVARRLGDGRAVFEEGLRKRQFCWKACIGDKIVIFAMWCTYGKQIPT
jgi:hypothetical protein